MAKILTLSLSDLSIKALGRRVEHVRDDPRIPLCVKLEGAVLRTGTTAELALALLRRHPFKLVVLLWWMVLGRSEFRGRVAAGSVLDPTGLPYRWAVLAFLRREGASGRNIILVSRANPAITRAIANHLGVFSDIIEIERDGRSDGETVARHLCARFGSGDFDYAGNDRVDVPVWRTARRSVVVAPSPRLLKDSVWNSQAADILCPDDRGSRRYTDALRPGRWIKNLLIFIPLLGVGSRLDLHFAVSAYLAFCAYCLIASAGYIANDLIDLAADRKHITKRRRVFASGRLSLGRGTLLSGLLLAAGMGLSLFLSPLLAGWMALYLLLSLNYSLWIKKTLVIDTFALTALYMHRILTGFILAGTSPSLWSMLFASFFFLGLAMLARYGELRCAWRSGSRRATRASAYRAADLDILASVGLASGYLSALILALVPATPEAHMLFRSPQVLWGLCPLLIYWVTRVWIYGRRGRVPDDPVLFMLEDAPSGYVALASMVILLVGTFVQLPAYTLV